MRFKRILTLVKTNLIFATQPAQLQNYRKKQAKNPTKPVNVAMRTLIQQLMFAVIFGGFFGFVGMISGRSYSHYMAYSQYLCFLESMFIFLEEIIF